MWANLGLMEHEGGDYAEAIKSFQQAIRLKPSLYVPNLFLGIDSHAYGKHQHSNPIPGQGGTDEQDRSGSAT